MGDDHPGCCRLAANCIQLPQQQAWCSQYAASHNALCSHTPPPLARHHASRHVPSVTHLVPKQVPDVVDVVQNHGGPAAPHMRSLQRNLSLGPRQNTAGLYCNCKNVFPTWSCHPPVRVSEQLCEANRLHGVSLLLGTTKRSGTAVPATLHMDDPFWEGPMRSQPPCGSLASLQ